MKIAFNQVSKLASKGAALIIVLAFVVLLTGLSLAYFSRAGTDRQLAQSSFNDADADLLAKSALDIIVGDLKQEIVAGSTPVPGTGVAIYVPTSAANMLPQRSGNLADVPNLIRRSVRGDQIPAPGVKSRASAVNSTTDFSANGRSVTPARWNSHYLVPKKNTDNDDSEPVDTFGAATPDWVIVTRAGPTPFPSWNAALKDPSSSNTKYAVGRYAYAIYDEGGLLDVNVAGYPTDPSGSAATQRIGRKGSLAYADLGALPFPIPNGPPPAAYQVDKLVGWRNYATTQPTNAFPDTDFAANFRSSPPAGSPTPAVSFYNFVCGAANGFLTVRSDIPPFNQRTDQVFLSRQELLAFRSATGFSANALQYLGTFSRELNQPSWKPSTPAGSTIDYAALAENSTAINRDLATVRGFDGQPLLKTRFPLTRINELTDTANANIQRDFGLTWNAAQNHWDYVGATGSTVLSAIERLDQVAIENREPNFFEILKAVILSGSIGLGSTGNTFVITEAKYSNADHQIVQIGANIIDAWDTDNIPSFINFGGNELAGVENLPYLSKLVFDFWVSSHGNDGDHDQWSAWLVPSFWNPHQNAAIAPIAQDVRFVMTSGSVMGWLVLDSHDGPYPTNTITSTGTTPYVEVKANLFPTACPPVPTPASSPAPSNEGGNPPHSTEVGPVTEGNSRYDAIVLGDGIQIAKHAYQHVAKAFPMFAGSPTFEMQVQINGTWKAYENWKSCNNGNSDPPPGTPIVFNHMSSPGSNTYKDVSFQDPEFVCIDPRTVRFGVWASQASDYNNDGDKNYFLGAEDTMDQRVATGGLQGVANGLRPQPATAFPMSPPAGKAYLRGYLYAANTSTTDYYNDLDGVKRPGDSTTNPPFDGVSSTNTIMYASASPSPSPTPSNYQDRPRIPSEQFQSVAELGQVFRDQPWKTLNFTTAGSGDAGLLDAFTLHDVPMMAGRTSLNTRQQGVLAAILSRAAKNLIATSIITTAQANAIVNALMNLTAASPMISKAELVTRLAADPSITNLGNKEARECVVRAFSDACQTRTWNLLIDIIAQSGQYAPNANSLADFIVEGDKHYWLHVAIDRFTGQIIDKQLEMVTNN